MKLLWWKKLGDWDYELCVEWTRMIFKKHQGRARGNCTVWRWLPSGTRVPPREAVQLVEVWQAIEDGVHDDKERDKSND